MTQVPTLRRVGVLRADICALCPSPCEYWYCIGIVRSLYPEGWFREFWCGVVWCGFVPDQPVCGVMYETGVTMGWQPYMIQSKDEPLRAVAVLFEDWLAGEEDWNP